MTATRRALIAAAALAPLGARAQEAWPSRSLRFIVPFPPGGAADMVGRLLAAHLQATLGRPVAVENRGGAGSTIGVDALAKSPPDGYAIGLGNIAANAIVPAVRRQPLPYDPLRDFAPVANLVVTPCYLALNPARLPAVRDVAGLVAHARANPDQLNFASSGVGTSLHLGMELFMRAAGIRMTHVPFNGGGPSLQALLAGQVDLMIDTVGTSWPQVRDGRLRALAMTTPQRLPSAPEVPTLAESFPGVQMTPWHGLMAPAGTPPAIVERLAAATRGFLALPETVERYRTLGFEAPAETTPAAFAAFIAREIETFRELARAANISVE
jgi:tripartite-type tricarboxylate transporter receptor subunit TctC